MSALEQVQLHAQLSQCSSAEEIFDVLIPLWRVGTKFSALNVSFVLRKLAEAEQLQIGEYEEKKRKRIAKVTSSSFYQQDIKSARGRAGAKVRKKKVSSPTKAFSRRPYKQQYPGFNRLRSDPRVKRILDAVAVAKFSHLPAQGVANILWGISSLGCLLPANLSEALLNRLHGLLEEQWQNLQILEEAKEHEAVRLDSQVIRTLPSTPKQAAASHLPKTTHLLRFEVKAPRPAYLEEGKLLALFKQSASFGGDSVAWEPVGKTEFQMGVSDKSLNPDEESASRTYSFSTSIAWEHAEEAQDMFKICCFNVEPAGAQSPTDLVSEASFSSSSLQLNGSSQAYKLVGDETGILRVWLEEAPAEDKQKQEDDEIERKAKARLHEQNRAVKSARKRQQEREELLLQNSPLPPKTVSELIFSLAICRVKKHKFLAEKRLPLSDGGFQKSTEGPANGHLTLSCSKMVAVKPGSNGKMKGCVIVVYQKSVDSGKFSKVLGTTEHQFSEYPVFKTRISVSVTPPQLDAEFRLCVFDCVDLDSMGARDLVGAVECGASQLRHNPEGLLLEIKSGGFIMVRSTWEDGIDDGDAISVLDDSSDGSVSDSDSDSEQEKKMTPFDLVLQRAMKAEFKPAEHLFEYEEMRTKKGKKNMTSGFVQAAADASKQLLEEQKGTRKRRDNKKGLGHKLEANYIRNAILGHLMRHATQQARGFSPKEIATFLWSLRELGVRNAEEEEWKGLSGCVQALVQRSASCSTLFLPQEISELLHAVGALVPSPISEQDSNVLAPAVRRLLRAAQELVGEMNPDQLALLLQGLADLQDRKLVDLHAQIPAQRSVTIEDLARPPKVDLFGNVYHEGGPDPLAPAEADFFAMATLHSSLAERAQALDLAQCLNAAQRAQLLMALQQLGFPLTSLLPSQNASPVPETTKVQPGAAYLSSQAGTNIL